MKCETYTLQQLATIKYGKNQKKVENPKGSIPIYGTGGLMGYASKSLYNKPSVLIGRKGTIDKVHYVDVPFWTVDTLFYTEVKNNIVLTKYLYYLLMQIDLMKYNEGTTIPSLRTETLYRLKFEIPSIKEQKKILAIITSIDDKIELNNAINQNLEQQAQALYKSWFVDFEPFGGVMPEEWHIGTAEEIISFHDSKRIPLSSGIRNKMEKVYPYYGATSLMDYVDDYLFDGIYLLLGEDGTVVSNDGYPILQYVYGKFWVNNHAHIITGTSGFSVEELYLLFSMTNIKSIVTGAVQQKVSQSNLKKVAVVVPSSRALTDFDMIVQPIFAQIRNFRDETAKLVDLRDTLLPKLMSGELDVTNIDI